MALNDPTEKSCPHLEEDDFKEAKLTERKRERGRERYTLTGGAPLNKKSQTWSDYPSRSLQNHG